MGTCGTVEIPYEEKDQENTLEQIKCECQCCADSVELPRYVTSQDYLEKIQGQNLSREFFTED